jgi:hypothetical protein
MVIIFSLMIMFIGDIMSSSDRIVLKEEFDIIANDIANRMSAYSSEVYLVNSQTEGAYDSTIVNEGIIYFDLPELVKGKQYRVDVSYNDHMGTIKVTYTANSNVYSTAKFWSDISVEPTTFYSQQGDYKLYLDTTAPNSPSNPLIKVGNNI